MKFATVILNMIITTSVFSAPIANDNPTPELSRRQGGLDLAANIVGLVAAAKAKKAGAADGAVPAAKGKKGKKGGSQTKAGVRLESILDLRSFTELVNAVLYHQFSLGAIPAAFTRSVKERKSRILPKHIPTLAWEP
ncbi:hypothetical protein HDV02_000362 [Globomyces sp. JEL0801]|nr:hypothetical protein HDV02_000362 [Globomyces sp. JEL0801]